MTRAELAEIEAIVRRAVRAELAAAMHSGRASGWESLLGEGAPWSDEERFERMDPTSTAVSGESTSSIDPAEVGRRHMRSLILHRRGAQGDRTGLH